MEYPIDDLLLVEDSSSDAELTLHTLRKSGMAGSIRIIEDGQEALDYLFCRGGFQGRRMTDRPRVILLDLKLPKVDGLEVLRAIRADDRTRAIPVVILTSSKEQKDLVAGYRSGANAFIQKPVDFDEFRETIHDIGVFWLRTNQPPPAGAFAGIHRPETPAMIPKSADKVSRRQPVTRSLSVLILENDSADFDLLAHELRRFGFAADCRRAETESEYLFELGKEPDVILADYRLPGFDALRALELLQENSAIIPFIVLTGAVSEETMVECMKRGASDYLLKDRVMRLGPAVSRALDECELRRQKQAAERALRQKNIALEELYHQAQAASRMKSAFLANMSHELRTPLTAVIGFTELVVDGKAGGVSIEQLDLLQDVLGNARHLLALINDVLDLAKIESGTMRFHPEATSLSEIAGEAVAGLRVLAAEKKIALRSDIRLPEVKMLLDPQRLKQVLFNYISNALKFTPAGGSVTVRAMAYGQAHFRIEVEDTGIGIALADIPHLFADFHQLDDTLAKRVQGTGLGLALTRRIVEAQGGTVGVSSTPGKGSTFFAILPYTLEPAVEDAVESGLVTQ